MKKCLLDDCFPLVTDVRKRDDICLLWFFFLGTSNGLKCPSNDTSDNPFRETVVGSESFDVSDLLFKFRWVTQLGCTIHQRSDPCNLVTPFGETVEMSKLGGVGSFAID